MDPVKSFFNTLKCPVCKSQLEGNVYTSSMDRGPSLHCVYNRDEYVVDWSIGPPFTIMQAVVKLYEKKYLYKITQQINTIIEVFDTDAEKRIIDSKKPFMFEFVGLLFDFNTTTREKMVNRVQTVLLFQ